MPNFLFLLHETPADSMAINAAELGEIIAAHQAWAERLGAAGQLVGGEKLTDDGGRHLRRQGGQVLVSDGPYAEAHDVIGGFYIVQAPDLAAAEALAADCPHQHGRQWIEIRTIDALG
ncbi:YciI family protein [Inhella crocodyli]|uniref:Transcription initiation protein n=1 Tax=Inhella crocodyli TaxID=2499851 RepID=A0A3S3T5P3_9BURK|nr:YciI family protein [Inhella crocodyli]RVT83858.1 transcription initiation protein [Inhella crocodyli]